MIELDIPFFACAAAAGLLIGCGSSPSDTTASGGASSTSAATTSAGQGGSGPSGAGGGTPVDECMSGAAHCDVNATCTKLASGFKCECAAGYQGDGTTCADVDECANRTSTCDPAAICTNAPGTFTCACKPGDNGDGKKCSAVDSCPSPVTLDPGALPITLNGTTAGGAPHSSFVDKACPGTASPAGSASNDVAYQLTPTVTGTYTIKLITPTFDGVLYVVTDCASIDTTCVGGADGCSVGCTETLPLSLEAGKTYFIIVDGSSNVTNQAGAFTLEVIGPPTQIDVTPALDHDTIVNNGAGTIDVTQTPVDGEGHAFATRSAAIQLGGLASTGLPDDGFFPADEHHPDVQLHWDNKSDGPNSHVAHGGDDPFSFPLKAGHYKQFQVYGLATEGGATVQFTLSYNGAPPVTRVMDVPDWFIGPLSSNQFYLVDNLARASAVGDAIESNPDPAIFGLNLDPDPTLTLANVQISVNPGGGWFVFYGATAW